MKKWEVNLGNRTLLQDLKPSKKIEIGDNRCVQEIAIQDRKTDDEGMTSVIPSNPRTKRTIETLRLELSSSS